MLKTRLRQVRIECPWGSGAYMVPRCQQRMLITEGVIVQEVQSNGGAIGNDEARSIREDSLQLFGSLAQMGRPDQITAFMSEGITDDQLPFRRDMDHWHEYRLKTCKEEVVKLLEEWEDDQREELYKAQKLMTAPVFELNGHYIFDESTVLPFIDFPHFEGDRKEYRGGGYSEIHIRCIHPSHHNFWDDSRSGVRL